MTCVRHAQRIQIERSPNPSPRWHWASASRGFICAEICPWHSIFAQEPGERRAPCEQSDRHIPGVRTKRCREARQAWLPSSRSLAKYNPTVQACSEVRTPHLVTCRCHTSSPLAIAIWGSLSGVGACIEPTVLTYIQRLCHWPYCNLQLEPASAMQSTCHTASRC